MLHAVSNKAVRVELTAVICDSEQLVIGTIAAVLGPRFTGQGCFYHLCLSAWRKIQELGLSRVYKRREDIKMFCRKLVGLAFLPVDKVRDVIAYLRTLIILMPYMCWDWFAVSNVQSTAAELLLTLDPEIDRFGRSSRSIRAQVELSRKDRFKPSRSIKSIAKQWSHVSR